MTGLNLNMLQQQPLPSISSDQTGVGLADTSGYQQVQQDASGTMTEQAPPSASDILTGVGNTLTTVAWVAAGGIALYVAWPYLMGARRAYQARQVRAAPVPIRTSRARRRRARRRRRRL
jgi:hypothetical protein